jgi:hypothetical protein
MSGVRKHPEIHYYVASRLDDVLEPPQGEEFDPYRDTKYSKIVVGDFDTALIYASKDYHECGRVEETRERRRGFVDVVAAWMVFPDRTFERTEP